MESVPVKKIVKEGTILITRRKPKAFYMHMGIVTVEDGGFYVYDLHPENRNDQNGNLSRRTLEEYMKDKNLIGIYDTGATTGRIKSVASTCWKGKYEKYYFNCQQFIDDITHKEIRSDLFSYYTAIFIGMGIAGVAVFGLTVCFLSGAKKAK